MSEECVILPKSVYQALLEAEKDLLAYKALRAHVDDVIAKCERKARRSGGSRLAVRVAMEDVAAWLQEMPDNQ